MRHFLESLSARLAGGPLDRTKVEPLYDHPACKYIQLAYCIAYVNIIELICVLETDRRTDRKTIIF